MMHEHVTTDDLRALRAHELSAADVLRVTRHLAGCGECAALALENVDSREVAAALRAELAGGVHLDAERELFPYADGTLGAAQRRSVEQHLRDCARCREDLDDLRFEAPRRRASRRLVAWSAIAAAVAIAVTMLLVPARLPVMAPPRVPRFADATVMAALRAGRIDPPPALLAVRAEPDALRGTVRTEHARIEPESVVLATTTPRFTWPGDGARAVVYVYDGRELALKSGALQSSEWTPETPLKRGRKYTWQVELVSDGRRRFIPSPPDPPALFAIVDEDSWNAIERARRANDLLLTAILEARAGLKPEALADFDAYLAKHPDDSRVRVVADSVRAW